jgi:hypothetical protein
MVATILIIISLFNLLPSRVALPEQKQTHNDVGGKTIVKVAFKISNTSHGAGANLIFHGNRSVFGLGMKNFTHTFNHYNQPAG